MRDPADGNEIRGTHGTCQSKLADIGKADASADFRLYGTGDERQYFGKPSGIHIVKKNAFRPGGDSLPNLPG